MYLCILIYKLKEIHLVSSRLIRAPTADTSGSHFEQEGCLVSVADGVQWAVEGDDMSSVSSSAWM